MARKLVAIAAIACVVTGLSAFAEPRVRIEAPEANEGLRDDLRSALSSNALVDDGNADPDALLAAAQADYRRLVATLYERGYYAPVISIRVNGREASEIPPFTTLVSVDRIDVAVEPGPRFKFGRAELAPLPQGVTPPETFRTGERARLTAIRNAADQGIEAWRQKGHAKAEISNEDIVADHTTSQLDVALAVEPGPKLSFGRLRFSGLKRLREPRGQAIAGLPSGETFDPDKLNRSAERLRRTGLFRSVALTEADEPNADGTLDIIAQVTEQKLRRIGFGVEVSSLDGGRVSGFWLHRNLLGGAERFRVEGEVSGIDGDQDGLDYSLGATLDIPGVIGPDTDFYATAEFEHLDERDFELNQFLTEFGLSRRVGNDIEARAGLGLRRSRTTDAFGTRTRTFVTLPLSGTMDRRDTALNPTKGTFLNLTATPFIGIDGTGDGLRTTGDARAYVALDAEKRFVLAGRLQFGSVAGAERDQTPADFLFYSGGGGTVRGHAYQSLGITENGDRAGGRSFAGLSVEARGYTGEKFQVVGFYDYGIIGADPLVSGGDPSHAGAGLGIRYDTGLGPIRLDVATPVTGNDAYKEVQIYVGIGQAF